MGRANSSQGGREGSEVTAASPKKPDIDTENKGFLAGKTRPQPGETLSTDRAEPEDTPGIK